LVDLVACPDCCDKEKRVVDEEIEEADDGAFNNTEEADDETLDPSEEGTDPGKRDLGWWPL
jgi:hypothetical protein